MNRAAYMHTLKWSYELYHPTEHKRRQLKRWLLEKQIRDAERCAVAGVIYDEDYDEAEPYSASLTGDPLQGAPISEALQEEGP